MSFEIFSMRCQYERLRTRVGVAAWPMDLWSQSIFRSDTPSTKRKATRIRHKSRHGFCVGHFGLYFGDLIFLRKQHHDVGMLGPSEVSAGLVKASGVQRGEGQRSAEILCAMTHDRGFQL